MCIRDRYDIVLMVVGAFCFFYFALNAMTLVRLSTRIETVHVIIGAVSYTHLVGMFCIAALLVGGASVEKASIGNVFLGVLLFHTMFIVAPAAGTKITGDSMIGEYFRVFVSYVFQ